MQLQVNGAPANGTDSYHLGHVFMDYFNKPGDHVWQIDAATGEVEMKSSVKSRTIQLARCLRNAGLKPGDVVAVTGVNHLDVHIPFYAGYLNGHPMTGIDTTYKYEEVKRLFEIVEPKLAICEVGNVEEYERVIKDLGLDTRIVTFGESDRSLANFIKMYDDNEPEDQFRVATFDTSKVFVWLISTSGTTGLPKVAAFRHSEILMIIKVNSVIKDKEPVPFLFLSSVQWISGYLATLCMVSLNHIKVQTSSPPTVEHVIDMINKYKPVAGITSPLLINSIVKHKKHCDLTCFKRIIITAFAVNPDVLHQLKARMRPDAIVWNLLGQTECLGGILMPAPNGPRGNCGTEFPIVPVQLVDPKTGEVITEPNKTGELWTKGPSLTEYYKNPEATAAAFSPDGWFKTGDLLYRDENGYFFYVERMSSSFRFRNFFITPMELEIAITKHPEVVDACVVGVPHPEDNMHAVACVQRVPGSNLTEQDVKDFVASTLSFHKHIHGGVIFVDDFPRTFSDKIARGKVLDFVLDRRAEVSEYPSHGNTKKLISAFQELSSSTVRYTSTGRN